MRLTCMEGRVLSAQRLVAIDVNVNTAFAHNCKEQMSFEYGL